MQHINQLILGLCDRIDKHEAHDRNLRAKNRALAEIRRGIKESGKLEVDHVKRMDFEKGLRD